MNEYSVEKLKAWLITVKNYQQCEKVLAKKVRTLGLAMAQFEILILLFKENHPLSQQALCKKLLVTKGGISVQINKLIEQQHVERTADNSDGRVSLIALTEQGKKLAENALVIQKQHVAKMFAGIPDNEAELALQHAKIVANNLSEMAS